MAIAYTPDPTDPTQPLDDIDASTASAEFRALKAYILGLTLGNQNAGLYRKNLLINGDFRVKQRLQLSGAAATDAYTTDRWKLKRNYSANVTGAVLGGAALILNPAVSDEFLGVGAGALIAAPTAAQGISIEQTLEYSDISHLMPGQANAKTVTLSGWINTPTAGNLPVYFQNKDRTRSYVTNIVIAVASTWQFFSVTVPMDVAGTWTATNPNDAGLTVGFSLEAGVNFQTAQGAWAAGDFRSHATQTRFLATNGWVNYFHGLQLEIGGAATQFEKRPLSLEMTLAARYYERSYDQNLTVAPSGTSARGEVAIATAAAAATNRLPFRFSVRKRTLPTMTFPSTARSISAAQDGAVPTLLAGSLSELGGIVNCVGGGTWVVGHAVTFPWVADADF